MITRRRLCKDCDGRGRRLRGHHSGDPGDGRAASRRREINGLALNDPIVQTLRDGVRILKERGPGEGPNWTDLSDIHGTAAGGFNKCPHSNWYFLPWHRAYLLSTSA